MNFKQLVNLLSDHKDQRMHFIFPDDSFIPDHYHITEVGKVRKDFIDCGGTTRKVCSCVLQVWVADDIDHRLKTNKLLEILNKANSLLELSEEIIEIEYEDKVISQYKLVGFEDTPSGLLFYLGKKHTDCLAPEKCLPKKGCCGGKKGCC